MALTNALFDKPDIFVKSPIHLTGQAPLRDTIRECHLKLTDHFIQMPTDERAHLFVFYEHKIRSSLRLDQRRGIYIKFHPYSIRLENARIQ